MMMGPTRKLETHR